VEQRIERHLEEISQALLRTEPTDVAALAGIHTKVEELAEWARKEAQPWVESLACSVAGLIERMILAEVDDPGASYRVVGQAVSAIRAVVCDGLGIEEVEVPPELSPREADAEGDARTPREMHTPPQAPAAAEPAFADPGLVADFVTEAVEHLDAADVNLLALETDPENEEVLNAVFRAFHTIKGVSGFLGLEEIGRLSHRAETLLDQARKGSLCLEGAAVDTVFDAVDMLRRMVEGVSRCLETGALPEPQEALPELLRRIEDVVEGRVVQGREKLAGAHAGKKLGEILVESGRATEEQVKEALRRQAERAGSGKLGELMVKEAQIPAKEVARALRMQKAATMRVRVRKVVKVDALRLDRLTDAIGELVAAEAMVSQSPGIRESLSPDLGRRLRHLASATRQLQDMAISLRLVPLRPTFQKMARLVHDLARRAGKRVEFVSAGEDTELDKAVVDKVCDPLVHMMRNAVDHGIEETGEERLAAGKSEIGRVELRAFQRGDSIYLEVEDDGRGLDAGAILKKARESGMVGQDERPGDSEIYNFVFAPGFTTAERVTEVSGRGVGMDVVKRDIEAVGGGVDLRSEKGKGTVFTLRLPLTLAVLDGMVVRVGSERYVIPTLSVAGLARFGSGGLSEPPGRERLPRGRGAVRVLNLGRLLGERSAGKDPERAVVVAVRDRGRTVGLVVDTVLEHRQIVVKSLGDGFPAPPGIYGGTILPDGSVCLVLDVSGLLRLAEALPGEACEAA